MSNLDPDSPHPLYPSWTVREWEERQAELKPDSLWLGEMAAIEQASGWETNEKFRGVLTARVARRLHAEGVPAGRVAAWEREAMTQPNEYWGELRAGRTPPDDM